MSNLKLISVFLVFISFSFVLVESFDEPISDHDPRGKMERVISKRRRSKCASIHTINELNAIIVEKALTVFQLIALERKTKNSLRKKTKATKSSNKIKNQIFVQFFGKNQTSVEINRQPIKTENENVPQMPTRFDIGKLNWTDASFDRNSKAIDFTKVTAEELKRILDEVVKQSNCPLGSFFHAERGCIEFDTFGRVPEAPKVIDIEALFAQPLHSSKVDTETGVAGSDSVRAKTLEQLFSLLHEISSSKNSEDKNSVSSSTQETTESPTADLTSGIDEGEIPIVLQSLQKNILRPMMEIESNHIVSVERKVPSASVEMGIESDVPNGIELKLENAMKNLLQNMSVKTTEGSSSIIVEPQIVKETFPLRMKLVKNSGNKIKPLMLSLENEGEGSSMTIKSPNIKSLNSELENALASLASKKKLSGGKIAMQYGNLFKSDEDKSTELAERETETASRYLNGKTQAFLVAEVPLVKENVEYGYDETPTTTTTATASPPSTPDTTTSKGFRLFPALVNSGKTIMKANKEIISNFLPPGMFGKRRFAIPVSNEMKENASYINKNIPKASISFESIEGKTLSDIDHDSVTEGMQLTLSPELKGTSKAAARIPVDTAKASNTLSPSASIESTTKSMNKN